MDHTLADLVANSFGGMAEVLSRTFFHAVRGLDSLKLGGIAVASTGRPRSNDPPQEDSSLWQIVDFIAFSRPLGGSIPEFAQQLTKV